MVENLRLYDLGFVQTLFEDEEAGASAVRTEALAAAKQPQLEEEGCNSIDIFSAQKQAQNLAQVIFGVLRNV